MDDIMSLLNQFFVDKVLFNIRNSDIRTFILIIVKASYSPYEIQGVEQWTIVGEDVDKGFWPVSGYLKGGGSGMRHGHNS